MIKPPVGLDGIIATFGDIREYIRDDGIISPKEEEKFLMTLNLPFSMVYAYNHDVVINRIRCHKLMGEVFIAVFSEILRLGIVDKCREYGGCYVFRAKRTSNKLSTHSWGIAIDINPRTNQLGTRGNQDKDLINVFKSFGFKWGGEWKNPDPMHFQYCYGY